MLKHTSYSISLVEIMHPLIATEYLPSQPVNYTLEMQVKTIHGPCHEEAYRLGQGF